MTGSWSQEIPSRVRARGAGQAAIRGSGLASALDLIPDIHDGSVMYTDWSVVGHRDQNDPNTASLAGSLVATDTLLQQQRALDIKPTDVRWELDVLWPSGAPLIVLGFAPRAGLSGLAGNLTRRGFHADGPSLFTGSLATERLYGLSNIGIDTRRHLLAESGDVTRLRSVLTAPARPLANASEVVPLLALAAARLDRIATAAIAVGPAACVKMTGLLGHLATRAQLARIRQFFHGTFTPPQAEITALAGPAGTTALDALTFPDQRTAAGNRASRSAASKVTTEMRFGGSTAADVGESGDEVDASQPFDLLEPELDLVAQPQRGAVPGRQRSAMETPPHLATPDQPWMQKCWVICSWRGSARSSSRLSSTGLATSPPIFSRQLANPSSKSCRPRWTWRSLDLPA